MRSKKKKGDRKMKKEDLTGPPSLEISDYAPLSRTQRGDCEMQELAYVYHDNSDVVLLQQRGWLPGAYLCEHLLQ